MIDSTSNRNDVSRLYFIVCLCVFLFSSSVGSKIGRTTIKFCFNLGPPGWLDSLWSCSNVSQNIAVIFGDSAFIFLVLVTPTHFHWHAIVE